MIRVALVGLGKMGASHLSIVNAHPQVKVAAVCDSTGYVLDVLAKYTGFDVFSNYEEMLRSVELDAVIIATPSRFHAPMVQAALEKGLHVFCEKPFCLDPADSLRLAEIAEQRGLVNQVGYHYRFVGAFQEMKRLLDLGAVGRVTHILAEAYGPVVLRPKGSTWRSQRTEGGGCLYDYAAHPLNLLNWCFGAPVGVGGSVVNKIFSRDSDDEVYSTLYFPDGVSAQLSVNWSDESYRKMSTKVTVWGTKGRLYADRQECQAYLRDDATIPEGYTPGWNVRYTTELTEEVWFYVRGEEYSAQIDHFVRAVDDKVGETTSSFRSAAATDRILSMILTDAERGPSITDAAARPATPAARSFSLFGGRRQRS
ncbi:MAG: Gfo/Idh/MocA family oxidoreductase [Proteobacteria bacterium]|nr:Gfo/Idh/MocA family oxidoreductase [Pseudomonadota bacterium]